MENPFVLKLKHGASLTAEDERVLFDLTEITRKVSSHTDILIEGRKATWLPLILEGWVARYKILESGRRQIVSLLLPGDLSEPFGVSPQFIDTSLTTLTPTTFAVVRLDALAGASRSNTRIEQALWWDLLTNISMERERVVSLGRRSAHERMAHLFCELHVRLSLVGLVDGLQFKCPITQNDLGDFLGLSTVHVNRSLQALRQAGLISLQNGRLLVKNLNELRSMSFYERSLPQLKTSASQVRRAMEVDTQ